MDDDIKEDDLIEQTYDKLESLSLKLLDERKKISQYQNKIKEFEKILSTKDENIQELGKQKMELQQKLEWINVKKTKVVTVNSIAGGLLKGNVEEQQAKIEKEIKDLRHQMYFLNKNINDDNVKFEEDKIKLQNELKKQNSDINDMNEKINKLIEENKKLLDDKEEVNKVVIQEEIERQKQIDEYLKWKENNAKFEKEIDVAKLNLEKKKKELDDKEKDLIEKREYYKNLAMKLNDKEKEIKDVELGKKEFGLQLYDEDNQKELKMKFIYEKNKETNEYDIHIVSELMNCTCYILETNLDYLDNNIFSFDYIDKGENKNIKIKTDELLTKYFHKIYEEYYKLAGRKFKEHHK